MIAKQCNFSLKHEYEIKEILTTSTFLEPTCESSNPANSSVMTWLALVGLPFMVIALSNALILIKLNCLGASLNRRDREISISLVLISVSFLILNGAITVTLTEATNMAVHTNEDKATRMMLNMLSVSARLNSFSLN